MAVLLSPVLAVAELLSPLAMAVLSLPVMARAELLSPVAVAVLLSPPLALAKLSSPAAVAVLSVPNRATALPLSPVAMAVWLSPLAVAPLSVPVAMAVLPSPTRRWRRCRPRWRWRCYHCLCRRKPRCCPRSPGPGCADHRRRSPRWRCCPRRWRWPRCRGPATDEQVAVPFCTRTVPLVDTHWSGAAEAGPAVRAMSRPVPASATAPRQLARRSVRLMLASVRRLPPPALQLAKALPRKAFRDLAS